MDISLVLSIHWCVTSAVNEFLSFLSVLSDKQENPLKFLRRQNLHVSDMISDMMSLALYACGGPLKELLEPPKELGKLQRQLRGPAGAIRASETVLSLPLFFYLLLFSFPSFFHLYFFLIF